MNPFPAKTLAHDFWEVERQMESFAGELKCEIKVLAAAAWRRIENPNHYCLWGARKGYIQIGSFEDVYPHLLMAAMLTAMVEDARKGNRAFREVGAAIERLSENMQRRSSA